MSVIPNVSFLIDTVTTNTKSYTVPDNEVWRINWADIVYTSSATVGNRVVDMSVELNGSVILRTAAGAAQTASTTVHNQFFAGLVRVATSNTNDIPVSLPHECWIPAGATLKFYDRANISSTDSMLVNVCVSKYKGVF